MPAYIQDYQTRQENKKTTRWTLSDWMATKQQVALMDQWLALNSSANIFDVYVFGSTGSYGVRSTSDPSTDTDASDLQNYRAGVFFSILGAEGLLERDPVGETIERNFFSLRLLGSSLQSTSLVVKYGLRKQESEITDTILSNTTYGVDLTMYFFPFFGVTLHTSEIVSGKDASDNTIAGNYSEAQAFIEANFLRVSAIYFEEALEIEMASSRHNSIRSGWLAGVSLHW